MTEIELRAIDLADGGVADAVLALQRRSYAIEAELIGSREIPPLRETRQELQACGETFLAAFVDDGLAGVVSWKHDGETLDLHRLAVAPELARRGIGAALIDAALRAAPGATRAIVQTGAANEPAKRLYRKHGFAAIGDHEVGAGLRITRFARDLPRGAAPR